METVEFFLGLGSRYSYLAFTQIDRIERTCGCRFALHPLSSMELFALRNASPFEGSPKSGQYEWGWRRLDAERWARYYGVPFREPAPLPTDHRLLARACHAAMAQGGLRTYVAALFRAIFVENSVIDQEALAELASSLGMEGRKLLRDMNTQGVAQSVSDAARQAHARGVFGVPAFVVGGEMFWGNDRLPLLEHRLRMGRAP